MVHSCLLLPDIFNRILDILEIDPDPDFYAGYHQQLYRCRSIARLARTCRTFLEPCLDVIWRKQYTLGPLVHTLPSDAYELDLWENAKGVPYPRMYATVSVYAPEC